ncbi:hypothetical protein E8D34_11010 [Nocardioides sp. GY 10113]|uniref:hypothetical protein n=1 Tax=Nocardioides sp. GY 10113 TaxID=2569761 RepID=UPI0010A86DAD|nr:hypothetical protein [Nocardioides sp. GY 10113]TIC86764.1 hypothetical protein E8D34_11010 [Nocardioides sp. GY 10113]
MLRQPNSVSCGATTVVAARALLRAPWRPEDPVAEITAEHRRLTSTRSARDRLQVPWPRRFGTPPWAVADAIGVLAGERVATVITRPRPETGYDVLLAQLRTRPAAVYLGNAWLPRHVVLALESLDGGTSVRVFDPAAGALVVVEADRWRGQRVGIAGWDYPWAVI